MLMDLKSLFQPRLSVPDFVLQLGDSELRDKNQDGKPRFEATVGGFMLTVTPKSRPGPK